MMCVATPGFVWLVVDQKADGCAPKKGGKENLTVCCLS
jgi:hypothetical protein